MHEHIGDWGNPMQQQFFLHDGLLGFLSKRRHPRLGGRHNKSGRADPEMEAHGKQLVEDVKQGIASAEHHDDSRGTHET